MATTASLKTARTENLAFVDAPVDRRTTSSDRATKPASPYEVQAGTVIPGALIAGIRSDLPGQSSSIRSRSAF